MALSRRTPSRSRSRYTLLLLVLTSVTLLTLDSRGFGPLDSARDGVLDFFSPVGEAADGALEPVRDGWDGATGYEALREENEALRQQILDLEGQLADGQAAREELVQLQAALDLPYVGEIPTVQARVSSGGVTNFDDTIELDKGSSSGLREGMPVVAGNGLVGQVVRVGQDRSGVRLITDPAFKVGVRVSGAPGLGIVSGQGDEVILRADSFDITTPLGEGDLLVTSGAARSSYPPDIPVGRVLQVTTDDASLQKAADVETLSNLNDLLYVTVLLWEPVA